jgi:hypothetical protein
MRFFAAFAAVFQIVMAKDSGSGSRNCRVAPDFKKISFCRFFYGRILVDFGLKEPLQVLTDLKWFRNGGWVMVGKTDNNGKIGMGVRLDGNLFPPNRQNFWRFPEIYFSSRPIILRFPSATWRRSAFPRR